MVDLYPNIRFPSVDFSWLGNLPDTYEQAKGQADLKRTLADLNTSDPAALRKAGNEAMKVGTAAGIETGIRLHNLAQARETLSQKSVADQAYANWIKNVYGKGGTVPPGAAAPGAAAADTIDIPVPAAAAPSPFPPPPSTSQGTGQLPVQSPVSQPGPQGALSPSDQTIATAQAAMAAPAQGAMVTPPGPQLAGPMPTPEAPPGPPPLSPSTVAGAQIQAPPAAAPPPTSLTTPQTTPMAASPEAAARTEAIQASNELIKMGPRANATPIGRLYQQQFSSALSRAKLSENEISYQQELLRRRQEGQTDPYTRSDFKADTSVRPRVYEDAIKAYNDVQATGGKAENLIDHITRLNQIVSDPNFIAGNKAEKYGSMVNTLASYAKIAGVNLQTVPDIAGLREKIARITDPQLKAAALVDEYKALTSAAVLANAGSLSKGFSEGDRTFTEGIFAAIRSNPAAIPLILNDLKAIAEKQAGIAKISREYMKETQSGAKSTPWGLADRIQKYNDENPIFVQKNGALTPTGERVQGALTGTPASGASAPSTAPPSARRVITGPGNKVFNSEEEAWADYRKQQQGL